MSLRTHFYFLRLTIFALCAALFAASAWADAVDDARENLNKAMNDYYNAVKASTDKSPANAKKLNSELVEPAQQKYVKAITDKGTGADGSSSSKRGRGSAQNGRASGSNNGPAEVEEEPDTSLDGKDVPALLEFPGAPPKVTSPKAGPSPKPKSN